MGHWMVLSEVVGQVLGTRAPVNEEVTVFDVVTDPTKAHIDSLGSPLANGGVDDTSGGGIIGLEWGR
jgi:hypothetical protein